MAELYNVSIISKYDVWLEDDEMNPNNWVVMSREQLEGRIKRPLRKREENKGREIVGYDDTVWKKFL
jgi:hypothetical protein